MINGECHLDTMLVRQHWGTWKTIPSLKKGESDTFNHVIIGQGLPDLTLLKKEKKKKRKSGSFLALWNKFWSLIKKVKL